MSVIQQNSLMNQYDVVVSAAYLVGCIGVGIPRVGQRWQLGSDENGFQHCRYELL